MINRDHEYWVKRAEDIADYQFCESDIYKLKLELEYKKALRSIQSDINIFYEKFANDNQINISEAKKILNSGELKDFKITLGEFIEKAKDNKNLRWEKELNNMYYKISLTRLQSLQVQIKNSVEDLYIKQQNGTTDNLKAIYKDTYYKNIYEINKGLGIGVNFAKVDDKTVEKVLKAPWHGSNYSNRIWNNKKLLINELESNLTQSFIRGDSIDKTSKIIANRMGVATGRARALVNTESAYITQQATFDGYIRSGVVKQYEILATLDFRTSKICLYMDGNVFNVAEKEIGVNAPPFHTNCRTTTVAYFDDALDEERIARDHKGKNYYVDGNMKYEDWYKNYV